MSISALVFDPRPLRMVLPMVARTLSATAVLRAGPPLRLRRLEQPPLPSPEWVRLRPRWVGVCGSDLAQVGIQAAFDNPLTALISFPHVMGHEIVAEVVEGSAGEGPVAGTLVAVDPWLGCGIRGIDPPCAGCAAGHPPLCARAGESAGGIHLGNTAALPGGFTEAMVAHHLQCHPLPPGLDPAAAVLADPLAVAGNAVDRAGVGAGPVLVLGAGTVGLSVAAVLRRRHPGVEVMVTAAWPHLVVAVEEVGAIPCSPRPATVVEEVARRWGGWIRLPWRGGPWIAGGEVEVVIDTVGSAETLETALRVVRPRGRVVSVGVSRPRRTETTLAYHKEVAVVGSNGYGVNAGGDHGLDVALGLLASGGVPHRRWLTHAFGLDRWRDAFATAMRPGRSRAIKVMMLPSGV